MLKTNKEKAQELFVRHLSKSDKGDRCAQQNTKCHSFTVY